MNNIRIKWISDTYDCNDCGGSYAQGAIVELNGEVILELKPVAHCYAGVDYTPEEVYTSILQKLCYTVSEEFEYEN